MASPSWLLLTYKVPPEPAAKRIALWRRLKGMGAVYLQNGVCLLPKTDDHVRRLKMLENDVAEMGGEAVILETVALDRAQEDKVVARFKSDRDEQYREFIGRCADFEADAPRTSPREGAATWRKTQREMSFSPTSQTCLIGVDEAVILREVGEGGTAVPAPSIGTLAERCEDRDGHPLRRWRCRPAERA